MPQCPLQEARIDRNGSWLCKNLGLDPAWLVMWWIGAVIWTIADFGRVIDPLAATERFERDLSEVIGARDRGDYALIAAIRGPMPRMFMTRVRL